MTRQGEGTKAAPYAGITKWRRGRTIVPEECEFVGCSRPIHQRGLCRGHYAQRMRGKELTPLRPYRRSEDNGPRSGALPERGPAPDLVEAGIIPDPSATLYWRRDGYQFFDEECTIFAHLRMIPVAGEPPPWDG